MRPLLLSGYGSSLRVSGHVLEVTNGTEGRRETFSAHQLPFDSVVVECNTICFVSLPRGTQYVGRKRTLSPEEEEEAAWASRENR